jgi:hypothetical protein
VVAVTVNSIALTDQQQSRLLARKSFRGAMNAGRHRTARIIHGYAPKVAQAEGKRPRIGDGSIMKIVTVLVEIAEEIAVIFSPEKFEEFGPGCGKIDAPLRLIIAKALACRAVISAKIGVGFNRGAVGVEGIDVSANGRRIFIARVALNAVELRSEAVIPEQPLIFEENVPGHATCGVQAEGIETGLVERRDPLAATKPLYHFAEIARQRARPAERVQAAVEARRDQFMETVHHLDAGVA